MPRRKKGATRVTTDEFKEDLFSEKVRDKAKEILKSAAKVRLNSVHKLGLTEAISCVKL